MNATASASAAAAWLLRWQMLLLRVLRVLRDTAAAIAAAAL